MSATHTSERYKVEETFPGGVWPYGVVDDRKAGWAVLDLYGSRCAAEYAARLLNAGVASVDPHAIVGCKVVAA